MYLIILKNVHKVIYTVLVGALRADAVHIDIAEMVPPQGCTAGALQCNTRARAVGRPGRR
jgi:hypothetical protein